MPATAGAAVALVFPPGWYYSSVPADLLYTGSALRARGVPVRCFDLNSGLMSSLLSDNPGYQAFRRQDTYGDPAAYQAADAAVQRACGDIARDRGVEFSFYHLRFPGVDEGHVPSALAVGLDQGRNPALCYLRDQAVPAILAADPALVAVALVHPDQRVQVPVLGRLLRQAGYRGFLCLYGSHEDVVAPEDFVADFVAAGGKSGADEHVLFHDFDGLLVGEAEGPLFRLWEAVSGRCRWDQVAGLLAPRKGLSCLPQRQAEDVLILPPPDYGLVDPAIYPFPQPVIDLRLSRGCPWGRCTFCAITAHQAGYRTRPSSAVLDDLLLAHRQLGSVFFRFRDDLLTPRQLRDLSRLVPRLPFQPRFSARARFEANLSRQVLIEAADAGLEELWLGLETSSDRVREAMRKGVATAVVERILHDADEAGIRVRVLCMLGYPGETAAEVRETLHFLKRHLFRMCSAALTPFQLMRNTPLGQDPGRFGLTLVPDPVPPRERIRFHWDAVAPDLLPAAQVADLLREGQELLGGWLRGGWEGPTLCHAWMRASVAAAGWPAAAPSGQRTEDVGEAALAQGDALQPLGRRLGGGDDQARHE